MTVSDSLHFMYDELLLDMNGVHSDLVPEDGIVSKIVVGVVLHSSGSSRCSPVMLLRVSVIVQTREVLGCRPSRA